MLSTVAGVIAKPLLDLVDDLFTSDEGLLGMADGFMRAARMTLEAERD